MNIILRNDSSQALYEQIKEAIKDNILQGKIAEDHPLPSIRHLSKSLKVSILTVKKAYDVLEAEGYIISRQGLGTFVAPRNHELEREEILKQIESKLEEVLSLAALYQIDQSELIELLKLLDRGGVDD
ncbi:GntR family transcriptional regulator [Ignavigranum ruoffiae]|uniref:GntR family transcriptional regulator n=1 Tax=Ignavigranum ruoffiae TaxID=89093 RepID=A0A1H9BPN3_9LACT|nr:GntR family transcriptional regulator [Ignavigranum ruoffiae]SEP90839.1 GntR family transcriptional regulator [Ignavigranum ruoffiae]